MEASAIQRNVKAADLSLEKVASSTKITEREKIGEASRQFEAVLLRQIIGQAQKPLFQSSLAMNSGASNAIYQDMITQQLADRISSGGSFGFGKVLEKELAARYIKKEAAENNHSEPVRPERTELRSPKGASNESLRAPAPILSNKAALHPLNYTRPLKPFRAAPQLLESAAPRRIEPTLPRKAQPQPGKRI